MPRAMFLRCKNSSVTMPNMLTYFVYVSKKKYVWLSISLVSFIFVLYYQFTYIMIKPGHPKEIIVENVVVRESKVTILESTYPFQPFKDNIPSIERRPKNNETHIWNLEVCDEYWEEQFRKFPIHKHVITRDRTDRMHKFSLVTQLSIDRLPKLLRLYKEWQAPLTAVIYAKKSDHDLILTNITKKIMHFKQHFLTVHIVAEKGKFYPVNVLRNVAQELVHAEYIMHIDVDFVPSKGLFSAILRDIYYGILGQNKQQVLVVHALSVQNVTDIPVDKSGVKEKYNSSVLPFNFGNNNVKPNYEMIEKWLNSRLPIKLEFTYMFEPYFVVKKSESADYLPWFQIRWRDKVSQVATMNSRCFDFWSLPDGFLVHVEHPAKVTKQSKDVLKCAVSIYNNEFQSYLKEQREKYCPL